MNFREWLTEAVKYRSEDFRKLLPELHLVDGTDLSVQASNFHMCDPQQYLENGEYESVEVYTHGEYLNDTVLNKYIMSPFTYGYVSIDDMETICKNHKGIKDIFK